MVRLDKLPLVVGAIAGVALALALAPRRTRVPLVLLGSGVLAFALIGLEGGSVIDRYLLTPAVLVMLFAAVAVAGWSMLTPGRLRTAWILAAIVLVAYGVVSAASTLNISTIRYDLAFRNATHIALQRVLNDRVVRHDLAHCGEPRRCPTTSWRLTPAWILDAPPSEIVARSEARADRAKGNDVLSRRIQRGVAIYPLGDAVFTEAIVDLNDNPLDQAPPAGFAHVLSSQFYAVYATCSPPTR